MAFQQAFRTLLRQNDQQQHFAAPIARTSQTQTIIAKIDYRVLCMSDFVLASSHALTAT